MLRHIGRGNLAVGRLYEGHTNALLLKQFLARRRRPHAGPTMRPPGGCLACGTPRTPPTARGWRRCPTAATACTGPKPLPLALATWRSRSSRGPARRPGLADTGAARRCAAAHIRPLVLAAPGNTLHSQPPRRPHRPGNRAQRPAGPAQRLLSPAVVWGRGQPVCGRAVGRRRGRVRRNPPLFAEPGPHRRPLPAPAPGPDGPAHRKRPAVVARGRRPRCPPRCHRPPAGPAAGADANLVRTAIEQISLAVLPLAERCMGTEDYSSSDPSSACTAT